VSAAIARIGLFDSGIGGLTVCAALRRRRPDLALDYIADHAHSPYGDLAPEAIADRSGVIVRYLLDHGAEAIVVACNTATAWAIDALRQQWPHVPFIGVEPGVKPALAASPSRRVAILATQATLASPRYRSLVERHSAATGQVVPVACVGLADAIEAHDGSASASASLRSLVDRYCTPLPSSGIDRVVLGCTHYPLVRALIARAVGPAAGVVETTEAVVDRVEALCPPPVAAATAPRQLTLSTTGPTRQHRMTLLRPDLDDLLPPSLRAISL